MRALPQTAAGAPRKGGEQKLITIGDIATELGIGVHRVKYLLKTRAIEPLGRAGGYRVFHPDVVHVIRLHIEGRGRAVTAQRAAS